MFVLRRCCVCCCSAAGGAPCARPHEIGVKPLFRRRVLSSAKTDCTVIVFFFLVLVFVVSVTAQCVRVYASVAAAFVVAYRTPRACGIPGIPQLQFHAGLSPKLFNYSGPEAPNSNSITSLAPKHPTLILTINSLAPKPAPGIISGWSTAFRYKRLSRSFLPSFLPPSFLLVVLAYFRYFRGCASCTAPSG